MHVIGKDRAGQHFQTGTLRVINKPTSYGPCLNTAELYGSVVQSLLRSQAARDIVRSMSDRASLGSCRRGAIAKQVPRTDELRPRSARIVRKPESIGAEDHMAPQYHIQSPKKTFSRAA